VLFFFFVIHSCLRFLSSCCCKKMYTAAQKIHKDLNAEPTEFEENVAQALFDLENTIKKSRAI
ncbi:hypothetical protein MIMGU_mgv1a023287mg, partial [Erythranthe guttata]